MELKEDREVNMVKCRKENLALRSNTDGGGQAGSRGRSMIAAGYIDFAKGVSGPLTTPSWPRISTISLSYGS